MILLLSCNNSIDNDIKKTTKNNITKEKIDSSNLGWWNWAPEEKKVSR